MPLYDYECKNCGNVQGIIHPIAAAFQGNAAMLDCPKCGKNGIHERLIADNTSFRLSWRPTPHDGKRTPVKRIGKQLYDADSYAKAKRMGRFVTAPKHRRGKTPGAY